MGKSGGRWVLAAGRGGRGRARNVGTSWKSGPGSIVLTDRFDGDILRMSVRDIDTEMLGTYAQLVAQAMIPIVIGSFKSLKVRQFSAAQGGNADGEQTPQSTIARRKRMRDPKALLTGQIDEDEDEDAFDETLSWGDTLLFPVIGSITLMALFLIIKYAGTKWINLVLGVYCKSRLISDPGRKRVLTLQYLEPACLPFIQSDLLFWRYMLSLTLL